MSFGGGVSLGSASGSIEINVAGALASIKQVQTQLASLGTSTTGKSLGQSLSTIGAPIAAIGVGITAMFGAAIKSATGFEQQMSAVQAVTNATGKDFDALRQLALQLGKDTVFSAGQAASGIEELGKAGVGIKDILGGAAQGVIDLAAATGTAIPESATIMANAMNIFGLAGDQATHVADVFAAAANKSAIDVNQLAFGMQAVGTVAAQFGLTIEETSGQLAAFADNGLKGQDAGTSLKSALLALLTPTKQQKDAMHELGDISFFAEGKFVGLSGVAGILRKSMEGLSDQQRLTYLSTLFGSDGIRAATIIYGEGEAGVNDYTKAMNDSGAAGRAAATRLDNLKGSLEQLKGSIETAQIIIGTKFIPAIRLIVDGATKAVNAFISLPAPVQSAIAVIGGAAGVILATAGAALLLAPRIIATVNAFKTLKEFVAARGLLLNVSGILGPLGIVVGALAALAIAYKTNFLGFADAVDWVRGRIGELASTIAEKLQPIVEGVGLAVDLLRSFGDFKLSPEGFGQATTATLKFSEALQKLGFSMGTATRVSVALGKFHEPMRLIVGDSKRAIRAFGDFFQIISGTESARDIHMFHERLRLMFGSQVGRTIEMATWKIRNALINVGDAIRKTFKIPEGTSLLVAALDGLANAFDTVVVFLHDHVLPVIGTALGVALNAAATGLQFLADNMKNIGTVISTLGSLFFNALILPIQILVSLLQGDLSGAITNVTDLLGQFGAAFAQFGAFLLDEFSKIDFAGLWSAFSTGLANATSGILGWTVNVAIPKIGGAVLGILGDIYGWLKTAVFGAVEGGVGVGSDIAWSIGVAIPKIGGAILSVLGDVYGWLMGVLLGTGGTAGGLGGVVAANQGHIGAIEWSLNVAIPAIEGELLSILGTGFDWLQGKLFGQEGVTGHGGMAAINPWASSTPIDWTVTVAKPGLLGTITEIIGDGWAWLKEQAFPAAKGALIELGTVTANVAGWLVTSAKTIAEAVIAFATGSGDPNGGGSFRGGSGTGGIIVPLGQIVADVGSWLVGGATDLADKIVALAHSLFGGGGAEPGGGGRGIKGGGGGIPLGDVLVSIGKWLVAQTGDLLGDIASFVTTKLASAGSALASITDYTLDVAAPKGGNLLFEVGTYIKDKIGGGGNAVATLKDFALDVAAPAQGGKLLFDVAKYLIDKAGTGGNAVLSLKDYALDVDLPAQGGKLLFDAGKYLSDKIGTGGGGALSLADYVLNVAVPKSGRAVFDVAAYIGTVLAPLGAGALTAPAFVTWTLDVGIPNASAWVGGDLGPTLASAVTGAAAHVKDFTAWAIDVGLPTQAAAAFAQGQLGDYLATQLKNALSFTVANWTGWTLEIGDPEFSDFSVGSDLGKKVKDTIGTIAALDVPWSLLLANPVGSIALVSAGLGALVAEKIGHIDVLNFEDWKLSFGFPKVFEILPGANLVKSVSALLRFDIADFTDWTIRFGLGGVLGFASGVGAIDLANKVAATIGFTIDKFTGWNLFLGLPGVNAAYKLEELYQSVKAVIGTISLTGLIWKIALSLSDLVVDVPSVDDIRSAVGDKLSSLRDFIFPGASAAGSSGSMLPPTAGNDVLGFAAQLAGAAKTTAEASATIATAIGAIADSFKIALTAFTTAGQALIDKLNDGMKAATTSPTVVVGGILKSMTDALPLYNPTMKTAGTALIDALVGGFATATQTPEIAVGNLLALAGTAIEGWKLNFQTSGGGLVAALAAGISGGGGATGGGADGPAAAGPVATAIGNALVNAAAAIGTYTKQFSDAGAALGAWLIVGIATSVAPLTATVSGAVGAAYGAIAAWNDSFSGAGGGLGASLVAGVTTGLAGLTAIVSGIIGAAYGAATAYNGSFNSAGFGLGSNVTSGFTAGAGGLVADVSGTIGRAWSAVVAYNDQFRSAGGGLIDNVAIGITNRAGGVANAVHAAANGISLFGQGQNIGGSLGDGMISGIYSRMASVAQAARNLAITASNASAQQMSVHSPSRVFWRLGRWAAIGLANGLKDGRRLVGDAAAAMARSAAHFAMRELDIRSPSHVFSMIGQNAVLGFAKAFSSGKKTIVGAVKSFVTSGTNAMKPWVGNVKKVMGQVQSAFKRTRFGVPFYYSGGTKVTGFTKGPGTGATGGGTGGGTTPKPAPIALFAGLNKATVMANMAGIKQFLNTVGSVASEESQRLLLLLPEAIRRVVEAAGSAVLGGAQNPFDTSTDSNGKNAFLEALTLLLKPQPITPQTPVPTPGTMPGYYPPGGGGYHPPPAYQPPPQPVYHPVTYDSMGHRVRTGAPYIASQVNNYTMPNAPTARAVESYLTNNNR